MPIEAKLDLHGHTRESGRQALTGFLRAHRAAGRRCVLVVTGKGLKDDWSVGALRQALPGWLNAPDLRRLILAYCQAQPQHGGSGAVYILLRRERGGRGDGRLKKYFLLSTCLPDRADWAKASRPSANREAAPRALKAPRLSKTSRIRSERFT